MLGRSCPRRTGLIRLYVLLRSACTPERPAVHDRSDDMDRRAAHALTLRLSETLKQLGSDSAVETVHFNPHAGGDAGYTTRVHRADGSHVDIIGGERSGYQLTNRGALGWKPYEQLVTVLAADLAAVTGEVEQTVDESTVEQPTLVDRMTEVASLMRRAADELCVVRDELMIERGHVTG